VIVERSSVVIRRSGSIAGMAVVKTKKTGSKPLTLINESGKR
jgi:hypothetical protein